MKMVVFLKNLTVFFRKYPLFRTLSVIAVILIALGIISLVNYNSRKVPKINSIEPPVGSPGDIMSIYGENFGATRDSSSFVEVGGSRLTASGYLTWTDTFIRVILPSNVQDGLVIVSTKQGKSEPGFFANKAGIPVEVPPDTKTSLPTITSVSPQSAAPGNLLTITGINFGTIRNNALVFFTTAQTEKDAEIEYIPANEENFDYEYWSDSEIHIRIPDGASSGQIFVRTEKGRSNYFEAEIKSPVGTKTYSGKKTYVIELSEDLENVNLRSNTLVSLRIPYPPESAAQPSAVLSECSPEPVFNRYQNTIIYQTEFSRNSERRARFSQSFVLDEYSVETNINARAVKPFSEKSRILYSVYTSPDKLIQSDDKDYIEFASSIVRRETNPYTQAKLVYDYFIENFSLLQDLRPNGSPAKDIFEAERGDAFDFAVAYTTILRTLGIPCITVSGILVDSDLKSQCHWWNEFYIENFGWVPVDIALGAGLEYKPFKAAQNAREFYFGNMDSQHITFSRGWNEVKPSLVNSNIVYRERTYALQSIWEESTSEEINYSSLWNDPVVTGIY